MFRGVAQLVARGVWDAEVASSSLVAPTTSSIATIYMVVFIYICLNRTCGTSQGVNASSSLVAPTIQGGKIKKIYFLYLTDAEWKDFAIAESLPLSSIATIYMVVFYL